MLPLLATPSDGSSSPIEVAAGTERIAHVRPLSSDTTTEARPPAWYGRLPPQALFGTNTVPSGPTLMCPCSPAQSEIVNIGTDGANVWPPSRLTAMVASAMHCEA